MKNCSNYSAMINAHFLIFGRINILYPFAKLAIYKVLRLYNTEYTMDVSFECYECIEYILQEYIFIEKINVFLI